VVLATHIIIILHTNTTEQPQFLYSH